MSEGVVVRKSCTVRRSCMVREREQRAAKRVVVSFNQSRRGYTQTNNGESEGKRCRQRERERERERGRERERRHRERDWSCVLDEGKKVNSVLFSFKKYIMT